MPDPYDKFATLRENGIALGDAGAVVFPELPGDAATAAAGELERQNQPTGPAPTEAEVAVQDSVPHFRQRFQILGADSAEAFKQATLLGEEMTATAASLDTPLEIPEEGISIANLDQTMRHWRDMAAGRVTEGVSGWAGVGQDMVNLDTAFRSTWGALQQVWYGLRIGESPEEAIARFWPTASFPADEGESEERAVVWAATEMAMKRTLGEMGRWSPLYQFGPQSFRDNVEQTIAEARDLGSVLTSSEWHRGLLSAREVSEYNAAGFGFNPWAAAIPGLSDKVFMDRLAPEGSEERLRMDALVREHATAAYAQMSESWHGRAAMLGIAMGNVIQDMVEDPLIVVGEAAPAVVTTARRALPVASRARVTAGLARHSGRPGDIMDALNDAESWVRNSERVFNRNQSDNAARQLAHAQRNLVRVKALREELKRGATERMRVELAPRANPETVAKLGRVYLQHADNADVAADQTMALMRHLEHEARARKVGLERRIANLEHSDDALAPSLFDAQQLGDDIPSLQTQLDQAVAEQDQLAATRQWLQNKLQNPEGTRLEGSFRGAIEDQTPYEPMLVRMEQVSMDRDTVGDELLRNIRRGMNEGANERELMGWEVRYRQLMDGTISPEDALTRPNLTDKQLLEHDVMSARLASLRNSQEPLEMLTADDAAELLYNQSTVGPDAPSQAAEAARVLAAGGDIDDVQLRLMDVDTYLSSYGTRMRPELGMDDAPNVWAGPDAFRTQVEAADWQQSMWEKMGDKFAKGLYPRAWNYRPIALLQMLREPMWAVGSVNPRLMRRIDNALIGEDFEMQRLTGLFDSEFRALGILDKKGKVDPELAEKWFDLMDLDPTSPEFSAAMQELSAGEMRSFRRMRRVFDFMGDKQGLRDTDRHLVGYISHVMDEKMFAGGSMPPEFQGIPASEVVFHPYLQQRLGIEGKVQRDITVAVDRYIRASCRKLYVEPLIDDLRFAAGRAVYEDPSLSWFPTYTDHMINVLQGRPSWAGSMVDNVFASNKAMGRTIERVHQETGRIAGVNDLVQPPRKRYVPLDPAVREKVHSTVYGATTLAYMGALTGNRRYFPMAVATGLTTTGGRYGTWRTLRGVLMNTLPQYRKLSQSAGVEKQWGKLLEPTGGNSMAQQVQRLSETLSNVHLGTPSLQYTENTIRGWTFHAALSDLMSKTGYRTWDEVADAGLANSYLAEAAQITQEINHRFGPLGRAPALRRLSESGTSAATQFLSFPFKQLETIASMTAQNPGYLGRYLAFSGAMSRLGSQHGVDLGQYVGVPTDFDTQSIMTETLRHWMDVAVQTGKVLDGTGDPAALDDAVTMALEDVNNLIPISNAANSWIESYSNLQTGEVRRGGELVRELDLGQFEWDDSVSVGENLSRLPMGFYGEDGSQTDMASVLTGLRATSANIEKQQYDAANQQLRDVAYRKRRIAEELDHYLTTGDGVEYNRVLNRAIADGVLPPDLQRVAERSVRNHALPRLLRLQADQTEHALKVLQAIRANRGRE